MNDLEWQLRGSELIETAKLLQREFAGMKTMMEELITALRADAEMWRSKFEAERADHERTIQHAEKVLNEGMDP